MTAGAVLETDAVAYDNRTLLPARPNLNNALIARAQAGDKRAFEEVIRRNMPLVSKAASRFYYKSKRLSHADLSQAGAIGLVQAVRRFDLSRGIRFSTYATNWITCEMMRELDNTSRTVRIPVHVEEKIRRVQTARTKLVAEIGREPLAEELADRLGMPLEGNEGIADLLDLERRADTSFSLNVYAQDGEDELLNDIPDPSGEHANARYTWAQKTMDVAVLGVGEADAALDAETMAELERRVGVLNDRKARVIRERYGLDGNGGRTIEAVAEGMGFKPDTVRRYEKLALKQMAAAA